MTILCTILIVFCSLIAATWLSRHVLINRERRDALLLTAEFPGPPENPPMISVVIAAKDEADNIETCLRTMLGQDYPNFEIIICNDRSDDETPAIIDRIAAEDPRVRPIHIKSLPDGWCGKNNAMQHGIDAARGEWICMIDADCRQNSTRTLSTAMQYATDRSIDFLSVLPKLEMRGFWENSIQPVCSGVMMIWFKPQQVNDPKTPHAYANGAFMLMKRSTYDAIGTHRAVKKSFNEDMQMAALTKAAGLNLHVVRSAGLYTVRMYTSLRKIIAGWSRIFFGTFGTLRRLLASLALLVFMGLLPYAAAAVGFALWAAARGDGGAAGIYLACGLTATAAAAIQISVMYRFYGLVGAKQHLAWSYPLGCSVAVGCLGIALSKLRKNARIVWRDTSYVSSDGE